MEDAKVVDLIRRMRHDLGNYLQVIGGYAELGRTKEISAYVGQLNAGMISERLLFEKTAPEVALYLFQVLLFAHELGILLRYKDIKLQSHHRLLQQNQPYRALADIADQLNDMDEDPEVQLSLTESEQGILMVFECEQLAGGRVEVQLKE